MGVGKLIDVKVLVIGFIHSIHLVRFTECLLQLGHEPHVYPSTPFQTLHPEFHDITIHGDRAYLNLEHNNNVEIKRLTPILGTFGSLKSSAGALIRGLGNILGIRKSHDRGLKKVHDKVKPDIIHIHEIQHAGQLYLQSKIVAKSKVLLSVWGIDLHFFQFIPKERQLILNVLRIVDHLLVEGSRDELISKQFGFKGDISIIQSTGGVNTKALRPARSIDTQENRVGIIIKGEDNNVRRGLFAISSLFKIADTISAYKIYIYSCSQSVIQEAEILTQKHSIDIEILPNISQLELFNIFQKCIAHVIINSSDGVSNSLLESMLAGCIPVIGTSSCANDFLTDNVNAVIVNHRSTESISNGLMRALENIELQKRALVQNREIIYSRFSRDVILSKIAEVYQ